MTELMRWKELMLTKSIVHVSLLLAIAGTFLTKFQ